MKDNPAFSRFVTHRSDLLRRFDALRSQIDNWIEEKAEAPSIGDLALLQGLLLTRTQVLAELVANDEQIMDQLFAERTDEAAIEGQAVSIKLGNPQPKGAGQDRGSMSPQDIAIKADMLAARETRRPSDCRARGHGISRQDESARGCASASLESR